MTKILTSFIGKHLGTLLCLYLMNSSPLFSQKRYIFPDDWAGKWQGELAIYGEGGLKMTLPMQLHLNEIDSSRWSWKLIYVSDPIDERAYELVVLDKEKGHYQIDEKNSIFLDAYFMGQTLSSRFSVNNSLLMVNYTFQEDHIRFDIFTGKSNARIRTGMEVTEVDSIISFGMQGMQKAILRPME